MLLMEYDYATDIEVQREEAFEKGVSKGIQQGIQQGEHLKAIETAKKFLTMGISIEQVAQGTGLSIEEINLISNNTK